MSGYLESEAVFKQRCAEIGLSVADHLSLVAATYTTMGRFAYGCSYVPGAPDDAPLIAMIDRICLRHPDEGSQTVSDVASSDVGVYRIGSSV